MSRSGDENPTGRFTGLSEAYARGRPDYPAECVDFIVSQCQLNADTLVVDVGCGTGISSRLFAERGIPVIGIEPNEAMLAKARAAIGPQHLEHLERLEYRTGTGEATGLGDSVADVVLSAQAFHWFDAPRALAEFHRIIKHGTRAGGRPCGYVALLWNERDESDPITAAYGKVVKSSPEAADVEGLRLRAGQVLLDSDLFEDGSRHAFVHEQSLDEAGFLGRAASISYAPKEPDAAARFQAEMRDVFARFRIEGRIMLRYETSLYLARRRP